VNKIAAVPPGVVTSQVRSVFGDFRISAVKTGMLWNSGIIRTVRRLVLRFSVRRLVVDPVMMAASGARLLSPAAGDALVKDLFPLAYLVTPNVIEAECLAGMKIGCDGDAREAARRICDRGARRVLIKGGHRSGKAVDWLCDGRSFFSFGASRITGVELHGSGCILSAAIAAGLAQGFSLHESIRYAKRYVTRQIRNAVRVYRHVAVARHA
jgi:hydroxymethylpyrimidine/phosphomethylpyrimidine kinase